MVNGKGKTVYEKCALAMRYAANELGGKEGLITLTEKSAFLRCAYCHDNIKFPPEQNHLKTISGFCPGGYLFAGK